MLKLFALTLLLTTGAFLVMALALVRRSRAGKCQCGLSAQVMARASNRRRHGDAADRSLPVCQLDGCSNCTEPCDTRPQSERQA